MLLCTDCKWVNTRLPYIRKTCANPQVALKVFSPVDGLVIAVSDECHVRRGPRTACGPSGKLFEAGDYLIGAPSAAIVASA